MGRYGILFFCVIAITPVIAQENNVADTTSSTKHWHLSILNGWSYMWESTSDVENQLISNGAYRRNVEDYYGQCHRAYVFSFNAYRIVSDHWGIGLKYSIMANNVKQAIMFDRGDTFLYTYITDREYVNYIGASAYFSQWCTRSKDLSIYAGCSLGYARYRNEFETDFINDYFKANTLSTGNTMGGTVEMGIKYFPVSWFSISGGIGCFLARFDQLSVTSGSSTQSVKLTGDDRKNVSRLDLFVGIGIYL